MQILFSIRSNLFLIKTISSNISLVSFTISDTSFDKVKVSISSSLHLFFFFNMSNWKELDNKKSPLTTNLRWSPSVVLKILHCPLYWETWVQWLNHQTLKTQWSGRYAGTEYYLKYWDNILNFNIDFQFPLLFNETIVFGYQMVFSTDLFFHNGYLLNWFIIIKTCPLIVLENERVTLRLPDHSSNINIKLYIH